MKRAQSILALVLVGLLWAAAQAGAQSRPYVGYAYPAGGQRGSTFLVKIGGQGLNGTHAALVSGPGVEAEVIQCHPKIGPQDSTILQEQMKKLRATLPKPEGKRQRTPRPTPRTMPELMGDAMGNPELAYAPGSGLAGPEATLKLIERIEARLREYVQRPAVTSIADILYLKVTVAPDAEPGERDLRVMTPQGISNPLVFCVGQVPETCRKPMVTSAFQVLGKEHLAQRNRPDDEVEMRVSLPCTMNGQIASGETNRYRFSARKGQRLVISCMARQLIPYIADAVPGWFQPVMILHDAEGREVSYGDDYRFKPDPVISLQVPKDGEYVLSIYDSIYRGREDFVYRISIGETPFLTGIYPLGGRVGAAHKVQMRGWDLKGATLELPGPGAAPGIHRICASEGAMKTNRVPFMLDTLPETFDREIGDEGDGAQAVTLPVIVNGRIDRPGDRDIFRFEGRAGQTVVAEVYARRLDCPTDSVLSLSDARGRLLILNDDRVLMFDEGREDKAVSLKSPGLNTHQADSYLLFKLPADGVYHVRVADTAGNGGPEYAYRLRISAPRPDFELRVVPSSITIRGRSSAAVGVFALRKDGYDGPITLGFRDLPEGFVGSTTTLWGDAKMTRLSLKTTLSNTGFKPVDLVVEGRGKTAAGQEVVRQAMPAEDRMQAFLWRHLVPTEETTVKALVYEPALKPAPKRVPRYLSARLENP